MTHRHVPSILIFLLTGCGTAATGDLNFVAVSHPGLSASAARADVEAFVLQPCGGDAREVPVGYELDLAVAEPFPVPLDTYCGIGVAFAEQPFEGALHVEGQTSAPTAFTLHLDPGLATTEQRFEYDTVDMEGVLALDLELLLDQAAIATLDERGDGAEVTPDDALGESLADGVSDALVWYDDPQEAADVYIDLWPDFDFRVDARVEAGGCAAPPRDTGDDDPDPDSDSDTDADTDGDTAPDTGGSASGGCQGDGGGCSGTGGSGCQDGGCQGSGCSGDSAGCDCGAGVSCTTLGMTPGWAFLLALIAVRRRP